jgi:hypothetical protein
MEKFIIIILLSLSIQVNGQNGKTRNPNTTGLVEKYIKYQQQLQQQVQENAKEIDRLKEEKARREKEYAILCKLTSEEEARVGSEKEIPWEIFDRCDFSPANWGKKKYEDKLAVLGQLEKNLAEAQGRPPVSVLPLMVDPRNIDNPNIPKARMYIVKENESAIAGMYDEKGKHIEMNKDWIMSTDLNSIVRTLAEESYHTYQASEIDKYKKRKPTKEPPETINSWINSGNEWSGPRGKVCIDIFRKYNEYKKELDAGKVSKNTTLENQFREEKIWYESLAHEKSAKDYAAIVKKMSYWVSNPRE